MSKRCKLQKEYYQNYGNYKGNGKYNDAYVSWLEEQVLSLRIHGVSGKRPPQSHSLNKCTCKTDYETERCLKICDIRH